MTLTLTDDGRGDADGIANGIIIDPLGTGLFNDIADSKQVGSNSGGLCFIGTVMH